LRSKWFLWFLLDYYLVFFVSYNAHCFQQTCRTMSHLSTANYGGWGECGCNNGGGGCEFEEVSHIQLAILHCHA
jgi:hypothetical protein